MHFPNYRDFYQKSIIPMGSNDQSVLSGSDISPHTAGHTHWLIALEGETRQDKLFYVWKVTIYPADSEGSFDPANQFFSSSEYDCINKAFEYARELEQHGKNDVLLSIQLNEKIS